MLCNSVSDEKMAVMSKGTYVSPNTHKNTDWALKSGWVPGIKLYPKEISTTVLKICWTSLMSKKWTILDVMICCRGINRKGEPYPPRSIYQLLAGLQRYIQNPNCPKLLNKNEQAFEISMAPAIRFIEICALKDSEPRSIMFQMRRKVTACWSI